MKATIALIGLGMLVSVPAVACEFHNVQAAASSTQVAMTDQQQATPVTPEQRADQRKVLQGMQNGPDTKQPPQN
jgi:hypothetical protein